MLCLFLDNSVIFSLLLSNAYNKPSYSRYLNIYIEMENAGLSPQRIFSSLHYTDLIASLHISTENYS